MISIVNGRLGRSDRACVFYFYDIAGCEENLVAVGIGCSVDDADECSYEVSVSDSDIVTVQVSKAKLDTKPLLCKEGAEVDPRSLGAGNRSHRVFVENLC